ncbi:ABC transporter substrate-binding protein [Actinoplanes subglobosus]|uniref:ABC transporter substrate-binding protein n=1 Tax=Actinoplanes subglobosus TaxID=1547892 RepID=A0ABV8IIB5_9ACTN
MTHAQPSLSRRGLLAAGGAAGLGALLAACGGGEDGPGPSPAVAAGGWAFTDDQPERLVADQVPGRIVAFTGAAAALADLGIQDRIVGVFGETRTADGTAEYQAGGLDLGRVEVVGGKSGEFSVEKYAALAPDLLITHQFDPGGYWYVPAASRARIAELAPIATVNAGRVPLNEPIERYAELAKSLGADLYAARVAEAKTRFEKAAAELSEAAKAADGIKVLFASATTGAFQIFSAVVSSDLMYFKQLGVDVVKPKLKGTASHEPLSWADAGKYHADIIFLDARPGDRLSPGDLASNPGWNALLAVKAGQVFPWQSVPIYSWAGAAPLIASLTEAIRNSKKLI